ncbi:hypothetical protein B0H65DRAFT_535520 [Neurospora tetraspora]|uniref:Uncharacterized protein n=1 Tax=Neurospora tetraspora TaxID=94610 RepID=A0AAE0MW74_9PEZI|nr:hypothetical protein B0H65DRAFT_535520 [Neurospora tetraspora]
MTELKQVELPSERSKAKIFLNHSPCGSKFSSVCQDLLSSFVRSLEQQWFKDIDTNLLRHFGGNNLDEGRTANVGQRRSQIATKIFLMVFERPCPAHDLVLLHVTLVFLFGT